MLLCNCFFHQTALHVDILNKYIDCECGSLGGLPEHWEGHLFQNSAALHLAFAAHAHPTQPAAADRFTSQIFPFSFYNSCSPLPAAPALRLSPGILEKHQSFAPARCSGVAHPSSEAAKTALGDAPGCLGHHTSRLSSPADTR